ncbi:MAG: M48 family metalloprotease [Rhodospirillales bacterium]
MIRDVEIENIIREYATPVFEAAGLNPKSIKTYLVNDHRLNAFVAGGQNMFINTGLLIQSDTPGQVIGVIAHETGHIAGNHLARTHDALSKTTAAQIVSMILGGVAVLAGAPEAGTAILSGGQTMAVRSFLAYSRGHESSADQAAMTYLDRTGQSAKGLLEFMGKLESNELLISASRDPYLLTHPLTRERIDALEAHVAWSKFSDIKDDPRLIALHERMKAKLIAFITPGQAFRTYKKTDTSVPARYARAIAYFQKARVDEFLETIDGLIAEFPNDPYFHEIRGQGLYENGDAKGALPSYAKAVELLPESDLLRLELARVELAVDDPAKLDDAIENLKFAAHYERFSPTIYQLLGNAYYKKGDEPRARLYHADAAFLRGEMEKAIYNGEVASRSFRQGSSEWLRAQDIINAAKVQQQKRSAQ